MRLKSLATLITFMLVACAAPSNDLGAFDPAEIRAAERALERALESDDPTAWVYHYTEDAWFVAPGAPPVQGRGALLGMAAHMKALSSVSISSQRTDGAGVLAYTFGEANWVNGRAPNAGSTTNVRLTIVWRKESDGRWRVAHELLSPKPPAGRQ